MEVSNYQTGQRRCEVRGIESCPTSYLGDLDQNYSCPSSYQASAQNLCDSCMKIQTLLVQIASVEAQLLQMRSKLLDSKKERNNAHCRLLQMPPEVVSEIFELCLHDGFNQPMGRQFHTKDGIMKTNPEPRFTLPLVLGAVCRAWRDIAWSTPRLWSTIKIIISGTRVSPSKVRIVGDWLRRTGQLPLTVVVDVALGRPAAQANTELEEENPEVQYTLAGFTSRGSNDDEGFTSLVEIINQYSHRWQHMWLKIPARFFSRFRGNTESQSILRSLTLLPSNAYGGALPFTIAQALPMLETVAVHDVPLQLADHQWTNVTTLYLHGFRLVEVVGILEQAPALRRCRLKEEPFLAINESPLPSNIVIHPKMVQFEVESSTLANRLLSLLNFPSLTDFVWTACPILPTGPIISMLNRSSCALTSLYLIGSKASEDIFPLLSAIPSLRQLRIMSHAFYSANRNFRDDPFLRRLATTAVRGDGSANLFLPELRHLRLTMPDDTSWWASVPAVLGPLDSLRRRPLETLHIDVKREHVPPACAAPDWLMPLVPFLNAGISVRLVDEDGQDLVQEHINCHHLAEPAQNAVYSSQILGFIDI